MLKLIYALIGSMPSGSDRVGPVTPCADDVDTSKPISKWHMLTCMHHLYVSIQVVFDIPAEDPGLPLLWKGVQRPCGSAGGRGSLALASGL